MAATIQPAKTVYFRRPQTPFVKAETGSKKDIPQWNLVSGGGDADIDISVSVSTTANKEGTANGNGNSAVNTRDSIENGGDRMEEDDYKDAADDSDQSFTDNLELNHHPESVLLCGYFHEEIIIRERTKAKILKLSTYLPGVTKNELRVYYGEGKVQIAGARALNNLVQRFERNFELDERIFQTDNLQATLGEDGTLTIQVPFITDPPPQPQTISVVAASPMILFRDRKDVFCLDIDVPGVKLKELKCNYSNGVLQLLWERLQPMANGQKQQMRYQREIPLDTSSIDTTKLIAYLDHITNKTGILTIVAPRKYKRASRPIEVHTTSTNTTCTTTNTAADSSAGLKMIEDE